MYRLVITVLLWICLITSSHAAYLEYHLEGASQELANNIKAHLGPLPETEAEALSFIHSVENTIQRASSALGYDNITLTKQLINAQLPWQLTLSITQGPPTKLTEQTITIKGEAQDDNAFAQLLAKSRLPLGRRLKHSQYDTLKTQIQGLGVSRGYFDGQYQRADLTVNPAKQTASVTLDYTSGPRYRLGTVHFPPTKLDANRLAQLNPITHDMPYHPEALAKLSANLQQTGYFASVKVTPMIEQADNLHIPINVALSYPPKHSVLFGIGYATDTEARTSITWKTPLINQAGHSQETKLVYSRVRPYLKSIYTIPLTHPLNDQLQIRSLIDSDEYGDLESDRMTFSLGRQTRIEQRWLRHYYLRLLKENWQQSHTHFSGEYILPGISFSHTKRQGDPLDPSEGLTQFLEFEAGDSTLGSSGSLIRAKANLRWLTTFAPKHRFIARAEVGATWLREHELDAIPPSLRFFAGGDQSIRGFAYQSLGATRQYIDANGHVHQRTVGGRYLLVGSLEYQYAVQPNWRLPLFFDAGNAFDSNDVDAVYSVGSGVHWLSPIGPVQLEFAFGISETHVPFRLHFSIGTTL